MDQVNIIILEEYRKILRNYGCGICSVGIEVEPDRFGKLSANNYCCKVNDRMAELSTKYSRFYQLSRTVKSIQKSRKVTL